MLEDAVELQPPARGDNTEQLAMLEGKIKELSEKNEQAKT